jgi:hypothetical protein
MGMSNAQLTFGLMSGVEPMAPYAVGDILVRARDRVRCVVTQVERDPEAVQPEVMFCVRLDTGVNCVLYPRDVAYRSR